MSACPGCGLANYDGMCPHCRGDQDAYESELVPPFPSSLPEVVSARRATPEARCVWLTPGDFRLSALELGVLVQERFMAADANPVEAVAKAIFDSSRESDDECAWDDEPNEWIKQAYRDHEALAVLVALGYPDGSPRQETPT